MIRTTPIWVTIAFLFSLPFSCQNVYAQMTGYDAGGGVFAEIVDIDTMSGAGSAPAEYSGCFTSPTNVFFGGGTNSAGFTVGMAYVGSTLYGLEFDGGSYFLYTVGTDEFGCAHATRVGGAVGVSGVALNSLAYCPTDDTLYTHAFLSGGHMGQLYSLDMTTGAGTAIGSLTGFDFRILGMTCDPSTGTLYGITSGHASRFPDVELVTIDRTTSDVTAIGTTGIPSAGSMTNAESLAMDTSGMSPAMFAGADMIWEVDIATGVGAMVGGTYNGQIFAMASASTGIAGDTPTPTNTVEATATDTPTETPTDIPTSTSTNTPTETPTPTDTMEVVLTDTPTETETPTPTSPETSTPTDTAEATATDTPTEGETATATPTETATASPTETTTSMVTGTPTDTATPTETPIQEQLDPVSLLELLNMGVDSETLFERSLGWYAGMTSNQGPPRPAPRSLSPPD